MRRRICVAVACIGVTLCLDPMSVADPIPGRDVLKFSQRPMINTPLVNESGNIESYHGHDELSTAWGIPVGPAQHAFEYDGRFMADDFADRFSSPVVHVKWWGSYLHLPTYDPDGRVQRFLISFEEDVPADPAGGFSQPGQPLLNQIVTLDPTDDLFPGPGTFLERVVPDSTSVDGPIYEYNAELHLDKPFRQQANKVYWLKIVALVDLPFGVGPFDERLEWGWHNRDYTIHDALASTLADGVDPGEAVVGFLAGPDGPERIWHFQDDAVTGFVNVAIDPNMPIMPTVVQTGFDPQNYLPPYDGPSSIGAHSKDLAFELYTVPEPATLSILVLGCLAWAASKARLGKRKGQNELLETKF